MDESVLALTAKVVAGYVSNNRLSGDQLPGLLQAVYRTLASAGTALAPSEAEKPAVDVKKSVFPDRLVCLVCGSPFRMLKRHLNTEHDLTVNEYRERYDLPRSYPVVSPDYAKVRSHLAKQIGLGRKADRMAGNKKKR
jgi:predicted transcriptional regulator